MTERRALQEAHHRRGSEDGGTTTEHSTLSVAVERAWRWAVAVWVRLVGGAVWGVTGFHLGVLLGAAGVPVVATARELAAAVPLGVAVGEGAAALLAAVAFPLGVLWTLRWDGTPETHRRRLVALVLLVVLPVVLAAVELATVGIANALLEQPVPVPEGPVRPFYHVATTLAIAFGAAVLWHWMRTDRRRGRWSTYD